MASDKMSAQDFAWKVANEGSLSYALVVYVVWWSKTLQNWKALVSTTLPDGMYYEVTHNGDAGETYLDAYKKFDNVVVQAREISLVGD